MSRPRGNVKSLPDHRPEIKFSFQYYDLSGKYCISSWSQPQIKLALERLKDVNSKTYHEVRREQLRFHEVDWAKTSEKNGFPTAVPADWQAFQFELKGVNLKKARVFGAFYIDTFYIVWFDLNHLVWPSFVR
jgi:hypothetical protein